MPHFPSRIILQSWRVALLWHAWWLLNHNWHDNDWVIDKMYQRIVVKLGTSVLTGGTTRLDRPQLVGPFWVVMVFVAYTRLDGLLMIYEFYGAGDRTISSFWIGTDTGKTEAAKMEATGTWMGFYIKRLTCPLVRTSRWIRCIYFWMIDLISQNNWIARR